MEYIPLKLETFSVDNNFPLVVQYGFHDTNMFLHKHIDFYELTIILSGYATHIVNNEKYAIRKGDVFVVGRDLIHGFENPSNFKICNIMYKPELILNNIRDIQESAGFHSLFVLEPYLSKDFHFTNHLQLSVRLFESANQIISDLIQEYKSQYIGRITMMYSLFWNLVVLLSRAYNVESQPKSSVFNLAEALVFINKNYKNSISVKSLATLAHMSVRNFSRAFHQAYNISPINYIIQLRIQHAYELLRITDISISEVAYLCGFQDSNYFARQFKRASGLTPKEYRNFLIASSGYH